MDDVDDVLEERKENFEVEIKDTGNVDYLLIRDIVTSVNICIDTDEYQSQLLNEMNVVSQYLN